MLINMLGGMLRSRGCASEFTRRASQWLGELGTGVPDRLIDTLITQLAVELELTLRNSISICLFWGYLGNKET